MLDLSSVCVAISSFKNDEAVLELIERLTAGDVRYTGILVVDSLGTGAFPRLLRERGLEGRVEYHCVERNLGSAGNLALRLELAARTGARYVYAVNHDGDGNAQAIAQLRQLAEKLGPRLGALYPLRQMSSRGGAFDVTGHYRFPFTAVRVDRAPSPEVSPVYWSSSNGALYSLEPARQGLLPYADLWMGYEDLGYGWLLHEHGYSQFRANQVQLKDGYEYQKRAGVWVTDKPAWYAYYFARNLPTVARRTHQPLPVQGLALARVVLELGATVAFRKRKLARLSATVQGLKDAYLEKMGKWQLP
jgi:GT2 family glycosyltransferase